MPLPLLLCSTEGKRAATAALFVVSGVPGLPGPPAVAAAAAAAAAVAAAVVAAALNAAAPALDDEAGEAAGWGRGIAAWGAEEGYMGAGSEVGLGGQPPQPLLVGAAEGAVVWGGGAAPAGAGAGEERCLW